MWSSGAFGYLSDYILWILVFVSLVVHTWCFFRFFPRDRYARTGLVLGNALVFVTMLGALALSAESYFRFISVETDSFGLSLQARRWFALHTRLNSMGFRDREWTRDDSVPQTSADDEAGVRRIAFVGDSFTYGWGIKEPSDRFPDRIQARFDQREAGSVEVMNVAKPGWGTADEYEPIAHLLDDYSVDEVVLCYVPNDIEKLLPRSEGFDPVQPPMPELINTSCSCLLDYFYWRVVVPRAATVRGYHDWLADGFADERMWRRHQQQLYAIVQLCRDRGVAIRVALLPFIKTGGDRYQPAAIHALLDRFFSTNGVPVVDLLGTLQGEEPSDLVVNRFDAHPNERAHALFADAIWERFYEGDQDGAER